MRRAGSPAISGGNAMDELTRANAIAAEAEQKNAIVQAQVMADKAVATMAGAISAKLDAFATLALAGFGAAVGFLIGDVPARAVHKIVFLKTHPGDPARVCSTSPGWGSSKMDMLATSASDHPRLVFQAGFEVSK